MIRALTRWWHAREARRQHRREMDRLMRRLAREGANLLARDRAARKETR